MTEEQKKILKKRLKAAIIAIDSGEFCIVNANISAALVLSNKAERESYPEGVVLTFAGPLS